MEGKGSLRMVENDGVGKLFINGVATMHLREHG